MTAFSIHKNDNWYFIGILGSKHDDACLMPTSVPNVGHSFENCLSWHAKHHVLLSIIQKAGLS